MVALAVGILYDMCSLTTGPQTIVVYPPTGSTAYEREMSTPPMLLRSMALLYLYLLPLDDSATVLAEFVLGE